MAATRMHKIRDSVGLTNADWIRDFTELRRNSGLVRTVTSADQVRYGRARRAAAVVGGVRRDAVAVSS
jgi:hypothetical protein